MAILNYTTQVNEHDTIAKINKLLVVKGAKSISTEFENQRPYALSFVLSVNGMDIQFKLPANWRGVKKALAKQTTAKKYSTDEHAMRVCWRIIKDWVEAQCAIIEAEQADMATIFLPYAVMKNGDTMATNMLHKNEGRQLLLDASKK